jgi:hypothetical protein
MDESLDLTYLLRLQAHLQEHPTPESVRVLLLRARAAGIPPARLYLAALKGHPRGLPLPPSPAAVFPLEAGLSKPPSVPNLESVSDGSTGSPPVPVAFGTQKNAAYPLGSLGLQIQDHWKKHRPTMYRDLEQSGKLRESVHAAQELALDALYDLEVMKKVPHDLAWEMVRGEWAFLPTEEDVAELGVDTTQFYALLPRNYPAAHRTLGQ